MNRDIDLESGQSSGELQAIAATIRTFAATQQENPLVLLALLRILEALHREIREGFFQVSLPDNRHALYDLLKDIEDKGGWPYIDRMKLRSLLVNLLEDTPSESQNINELSES